MWKKIGIGENKIPRLENRAQAYPQDWIFDEHDVTLTPFRFFSDCFKDQLLELEPLITRIR